MNYTKLTELLKQKNALKSQWKRTASLSRERVEVVRLIQQVNQQITEVKNA